MTDPIDLPAHPRILVIALRRLGDVLEDWQAADYEAIFAGALAMLGRPAPAPETAKRKLYIERPRGHDKTGSLATVAIW